MPLTVPLGMRRRLSIGHSAAVGWWLLRWRKPSASPWNDVWDDGEDPPDAGVREPRRPLLPPDRGAVGLPPP